MVHPAACQQLKFCSFCLGVYCTDAVSSSSLKPVICRREDKSHFKNELINIWSSSSVRSTFSEESYIAVVNSIFFNIGFLSIMTSMIRRLKTPVPPGHTTVSSSSISGSYYEINLLKTKLALLLLIMNGGVGSKPHPHVAFVTTRPNSLAIF